MGQPTLHAGAKPNRMANPATGTANQLTAGLPPNSRQWTRSCRAFSLGTLPDRRSRTESTTIRKHAVTADGSQLKPGRRTRCWLQNARMTQSRTELTRKYARRVLATLQDPAIRSQAQVVLRSPQMKTLTGMLATSLQSTPPSPDPSDAHLADPASQPNAPVNPFQQPTEDFTVSPTLVLDRSELDAQRHHFDRKAPEPATPVAPVAPVPPDQRRGIPDWVLPRDSQD